MAHEHLPNQEGARFLLSVEQTARLGAAIVAFGERFRPPVPGKSVPDPPAHRPRLTLMSPGPQAGTWQRTTFLNDGEADVTISAWDGVSPPYCHHRSEQGAAHIDDGFDFTVRTGGNIQTVYLSTDGTGWLIHRKLEEREGGHDWHQTGVGDAQEALAFAEQVYLRYFGTALGVLAADAV